MNRWILFILLLAVGTGCSDAPSVKSITKETELLEEGPFQFHYPKNWKLMGEVIKISANLESTLYRFHHPQNRECYVTIEIIVPKKSAPQDTHLNDIIAHKVRLFKEKFKKSGFENFSFRTKQMTFAKEKAHQLTLNADKGPLSRRVVFYLLEHQNDFFAISYQWFSSWKEDILRNLEEIIQSFIFIR